MAVSGAMHQKQVQFWGFIGPTLLSNSRADLARWACGPNTHVRGKETRVRGICWKVAACVWHRLARWRFCALHFSGQAKRVHGIFWQDDAAVNTQDHTLADTRK